VVAYWFDYQCPYCRRVEENVLPQLIAEHVDRGNVKIVFKDFQFLGPDSQTAASQPEQSGKSRQQVSRMA